MKFFKTKKPRIFFWWCNCPNKKIVWSVHKALVFRLSFKSGRKFAIVNNKSECFTIMVYSLDLVRQNFLSSKRKPNMQVYWFKRIEKKDEVTLYPSKWLTEHIPEQWYLLVLTNAKINKRLSIKMMSSFKNSIRLSKEHLSKFTVMPLLEQWKDGARWIVSTFIFYEFQTPNN